MLNLINKYKSILIYIIFGVLTTIVNYAVYLPCYNLLGMSAAISNAIACAVAILFAFVTNKPFVFQSKDWSLETVVPEFTKFVGTRIVTGVSETLILWLTVDLLGWNGIVWKLITSVLVVVFNYVGSKLLVFRNK